MNRRKALEMLVASLSGFSVSAQAPLPQDRPRLLKNRRLEHVVWNPVLCLLNWVVSTGDTDEKGEYRPQRLHNYKIRLDDAAMEFEEEIRSFSPDEALAVHSVLNSLVAYCMASTEWWEQGKGEKLE